MSGLLISPELWTPLRSEQMPSLKAAMTGLSAPLVSIKPRLEPGRAWKEARCRGGYWTRGASCGPKRLPLPLLGGP